MRFVLRRKVSLRFAIIFCLVLTIISTGCGGSSKSSSTSTAGGISGNWQMSLQPSNASYNPTQESGSLLDNNGNVTGGMVFQDLACPGVGSVSGNVSGSSVTFTVNPAGVDIEFAGNTQGSSSMTGDYTILSTGCSGAVSAPQTGTWTGDQVSPLNVTVQGVLTSSHANASPTYITIMLAQGSNTGASTTDLTGTASLSTTLGGPADYDDCFFTSSIVSGGTANVSGTISGTSVVLNLNAGGTDGTTAPTEIGQISGTISLDGTSFSGTYRMIGFGPGMGYQPPCVNGDTGTVTWQSSS
jgi:hypothetical protein